MKINEITGRLDVAVWCMSPNFDARPMGVVPELIIIHNISLPPGVYGGGWIEALFENHLDPDKHPYFSEIYQLKVSSHLLIHRSGDITQFVPFHMRAWHAGQSCYGDRRRCNDFSIGVELEGTDEQPYESEQYHSLVKVIKVLLATYPTLSREAIAGHEHVAPGRKTDPGPAFDWCLFRRMLA